MGDLSVVVYVILSLDRRNVRRPPPGHEKPPEPDGLRGTGDENRCLCRRRGVVKAERRNAGAEYARENAIILIRLYHYRSFELNRPASHSIFLNIVRVCDKVKRGTLLFFCFFGFYCCKIINCCHSQKATARYCWHQRMSRAIPFPFAADWTGSSRPYDGARPELTGRRNKTRRRPVCPCR